MKPRTRLQKKVVELSSRLPEITEKQRQWAYDNCLSAEAWLSRKTAWCTVCGGSFELDTSELSTALGLEATVCPHCGHKLKVKNCRKRKCNESWYYTILTTKEGFQVCRHYVVKRSVRKDGDPYMSIAEAVQIWIRGEDGKETIMARPHTISMYLDNWIYNEPMEIRETCRNPYSPDRYDIFSEFVYPGGSILPKIKKLGYSRRITTISPCSLFKLLLTDRESEILAKTRQYDLLKYKDRSGGGRLPFNHAIRIANRNGYIIKDATMWFDYLRMLEELNLDTHNAHYVCPQNLEAAHDTLMVRLGRRRRALARKTKAEEDRYWETQYHEKKVGYLGICFGNEDFTISVIQSVAEMEEEGEDMHHCVYKNGYYKREDCLILSAKNLSGKRLATIELNLRSFEIIQCRGKCNKVPEKQTEIIELIKSNINLIRKAT